MASILIVEDEEAIAELILIHTKMAGHKAEAVHDGFQVPEEKALFLARGAVVKTYNLRYELFDRFTITAKHQSNGEQTYWWVLYYPANSEDFLEIGCYNVWLDTLTGEVVLISSAADGLG